MSNTYSAQTSITINAAIDKVWEALTDPQVVKKYLHNTTMKTDWSVGGPITWSGEWNGKSYEDKGTVLKFEPKRLISTSHWSPRSDTKDMPENYHIVTYELSESSDQTTITLTQSNCPSQEGADNMIIKGWKPILQTIKESLED